MSQDEQALTTEEWTLFDSAAAKLASGCLFDGLTPQESAVVEKAVAAGAAKYVVDED